MSAKAHKRTDPGLRAALKAAGGVSALARLLKITRAAVSRWESVPVQKVVAVEKVTGVPRQRLKPELYA